MTWTLKELMRQCQENQTEINGKWVPARPLHGKRSLLYRIFEAWDVFTGKLDAFKWTEGQ